MSLADILYRPKTPQQQRDWDWSHNQVHLLVRLQIQAQHKVNLPIYPIEPVNWEQPKSWLKLHAAFHDDANGVLKTEANDLETVDWADPEQRDAWIEIHYQEHRNWAGLLKI
jgi:hypothetical protein